MVVEAVNGAIGCGESLPFFRPGEVVLDLRMTVAPPGGLEDLLYMKPSSARNFAQALLDAADKAEKLIRPDSAPPPIGAER